MGHRLPVGWLQQEMLWAAQSWVALPGWCSGRLAELPSTGAACQWGSILKSGAAALTSTCSCSSSRSASCSRGAPTQAVSQKTRVAAVAAATRRRRLCAATGWPRFTVTNDRIDQASSEARQCLQAVGRERTVVLGCCSGPAQLRCRHRCVGTRRRCAAKPLRYGPTPPPAIRWRRRIPQARMSQAGWQHLQAKCTPHQAAAPSCRAEAYCLA